MKIIVTKENEHANHLLIEAIYKGLHIRKFISGMKILNKRLDKYEYRILEREFKYRMPFPVLDLDEWSKNLIKMVKDDPEGKVIDSNSFEYAKGVRPMQE
ncbi:MAG: hypothetical protein LBL62_03720 [Planctomycetaceae bacterium]|jgi:hypothetical protein|nr:hypothetical protein [Planctomycetaceae bacterium]